MTNKPIICFPNTLYRINMIYISPKSRCLDGLIGYVFAEYGYSWKATEEMDVYGFGVVLLELVTGRQSEQQAEPAESLDIVTWVRRKVNIANGAYQVLDPKISDSSHEQMLGALEIALRCTSVMPEKRPPMFEVMRALQSLDSRASLPCIELSTSEEQSVAD